MQIACLSWEKVRDKVPVLTPSQAFCIIFHVAATLQTAKLNGVLIPFSYHLKALKYSSVLVLSRSSGPL